MIPESLQRYIASELGIACMIGLGVLVVGWLCVSFMEPGRARRPVEWSGVLGLYVALVSFFVYHSIHAWQGDHTLRLVAFGLLASLFGSGTLVTLVQLAKSFGISDGDKGGATN